MRLRSSPGCRRRPGALVAGEAARPGQSRARPLPSCRPHLPGRIGAGRDRCRRGACHRHRPAFPRLLTWLPHARSAPERRRSRARRRSAAFAACRRMRSRRSSAASPPREPEPKGELDYTSPFTLLVAVVLSAQATDAGVNKATPALFALADTPEKMVALGEEKVTELIRTIGLYRTKARNVVALSKKLIAEHGGKVPRDARGAGERCPASAARPPTSCSTSPSASRPWRSTRTSSGSRNRTGHRARPRSARSRSRARARRARRATSSMPTTG